MRSSVVLSVPDKLGGGVQFADVPLLQDACSKPKGWVALKVAVEYSFRLRYQDDLHEVVVPASRLLDVPLDVEAVRRVVEDDESLLAELFRDFLPQYQLMLRDPEYWSKELERDDEMIRLVEVV